MPSWANAHVGPWAGDCVGPGLAHEDHEPFLENSKEIKRKTMIIQISELFLGFSIYLLNIFVLLLGS